VQWINLVRIKVESLQSLFSMKNLAFIVWSLMSRLIRVRTNNNWLTNRTIPSTIPNVNYFWSSIQQRDLIFGRSIRGPGSSMSLISDCPLIRPRTKFSSNLTEISLAFVLPCVTEIKISLVLNSEQNVTITILTLTFIILSIRKIWIRNYFSYIPFIMFFF